MRKLTWQDIGAAVFSVSVFVGVYGIVCLLLCGMAIFVWEELDMDPILETLLISIVTSIFTSGLSAIVTYKIFLERLLKRHEERITDKLNPGGHYLHEEHAEIKSAIRERNTEMRGELRKDLSEMKSVLDAVNLRSAVDAERYKLLDVSQQAVVDAARRLDGMATAYQNAIAEANRLSEENLRLKARLQRARPAPAPAWDRNPEPEIE